MRERDGEGRRGRGKERKRKVIQQGEATDGF